MDCRDSDIMETIPKLGQRFQNSLRELMRRDWIRYSSRGFASLAILLFLFIAGVELMIGFGEEIL
jgi:hypothetical protein